MIGNIDKRYMMKSMNLGDLTDKVEARVNLGVSDMGGSGTAAGIRSWLLVDYTTSVINVKDSTYGAVGDGSTVDTVAIEAAIVAANASGLLHNRSCLYFPAGKYIVGSNALTAIKTNVYGPDATIMCIPTETGTDRILRVDYTSTVGQTFVLRAIHGPGYGTSGIHKCGLEIIGADNSRFYINQLEALDTGISLNGGFNNGHIAQNTFYVQTIMSVNKGFNLTAGTDIQTETNTFYVEYFQLWVDNSIGVYCTNATGAATYVSNNRFVINTIEQNGASTCAFYLTGTTPAKIIQNVFEVTNNLAVSASSKILLCSANIGINRFNLSNNEQSFLSFSSRQLFGPGNIDWTYGVSTIQLPDAPTSAATYWGVGDICWHTNGATPNGWRCTTAGSPGSWTAF